MNFRTPIKVDDVHGVVQCPPIPPENKSPTPDRIPQYLRTASTSPLELWEPDLITLLRVGKAGALSDPEREKAQEFADRLDVVRPQKTTVPNRLTAGLVS